MTLNNLLISAMNTPKGPRIALAVPNEDATGIVDRRDITGECYKAVVGICLPLKETGLPIEVNGVPKYRITVTEIKDEKTPSAIILPPGRQA